MSRPTVTISKFVGTISLGLLTGLSYTLSTTSLPPLLLLPTASPASLSFQHLRTLTERHQILLSTLSTSSFLLAYAISPSRGRHPYLLWAVLATGLGFGKEALGWWRGDKSRDGQEGWEVEGGDINGEVLKGEMESWRGTEAWRAGIWAVGWAISVVGIWGDRL